MNYLSFIKNNLFTIILSFILIFSMVFFNYKLKSLNKENKTLKENIEQKNTEIDSLTKNLSKLESILKEKEKQKQIEDNLIIESQKKEAIVTQCKDEFINIVEEKKEDNDEFKTWCEEPIPISVSDIIMYGVR